jgi:hypothetical protein
MQERQYMPMMLSKSRFNRRLHRVKWLLLNLFATLGERFKAENDDAIYLLDTFPVSVCDKAKRWRSCHQGQDQGEGKSYHSPFAPVANQSGAWSPY